jgi:hypothetical protein
MKEVKTSMKYVGIGIAAFSLALLGGCWGGGDDGGTTTTTTEDVTYDGTVGTGLAAANVDYVCTDTTGATMGEGVTGVDGSYQVTLTTDELKNFTTPMTCTADLGGGVTLKAIIPGTPTADQPVTGNINLITNLVADEIEASGETVTADVVAAKGKEVVNAIVGTQSDGTTPLISYDDFASQKIVARSANTETNSTTKATVSPVDLVLDTISDNLNETGATTSAGSVTAALAAKKASVTAGTAKPALNDPELQVELAANAAKQGVSSDTVAAAISDTTVKETVQSMQTVLEKVKSNAAANADTNVSNNSDVVMKAVAKSIKVAVVAQTSAANADLTSDQIAYVVSNTVAVVEAKVTEITAAAAADNGVGSSPDTLKAVVETSAKQAGAVVGQIDVRSSTVSDTVKAAIKTQSDSAATATQTAMTTAINTAIDGGKEGSAALGTDVITDTVVQSIANSTISVMDAVVADATLGNIAVSTDAVSAATSGKALTSSTATASDFVKPVVEVTIEMPFTTTATVTLGGTCVKASVSQKNVDNAAVLMIGDSKVVSASGSSTFTVLHSKVAAVRIDAQGSNSKGSMGSVVSSSSITTSTAGTQPVSLTVNNCPATTGGSGGTQ